MSERINKRWVEKQFDNALTSTFRNMILHASFIEAVVKIIVKKDLTFEKSIIIFPEVIVRDFLHKLRSERNDLLHDIIKKDRGEMHINKQIVELWKSVTLVYRKSEEIRNYFVVNYKFDPRDKVNNLTR